MAELISAVLANSKIFVNWETSTQTVIFIGTLGPRKGGTHAMTQCPGTFGHPGLKTLSSKQCPTHGI